MTRTVRGARNRPGFALFMALGALVIIGVLVAGSSFISMQEMRLGQNTLMQAKAFSVAEFGLNKIQSDWDKTPNLQMSNGAKFDTSYVVQGQGRAKVRYVRLNNETFWIVSEGMAYLGDSTNASRVAVKRVGAVLRLRIPTIKANGAVTTAGNITVKGSSQVNGDNHTPAGWTGCATGDTLNKAAIVVKPGVTPDIQKESNATGTPQWTTDPLAAQDQTYVTYGDETWNSLKAMANVTLPATGSPPVSAGPDAAPVAANGACNKAVSTNWGEPWRFPALGLVEECVNYFPIIYAAGTLHMNGGRGQGILLVEGDVKINGQFEFYGLIVAKDDIIKGNGSAKLHGAIMSRNANIVDPSDILGNITINYSQCSLERAMRGSAQVVQAKERAWTELY
jgi:cytoskeletal protein CcmA (bactofilin family)